MNMKKYTQRLVLLMVIFSVSAHTALASHRGGYDSVDRSDLDDDAVSSFPIPVLFGVSYASLVPDFGDPRGGGTRSHEGQDMRALQGTPIVSPTEAVVTGVGTGASAGKYVYTANPGGESFRYMHLDSIADIERGDKLSVGDFIGTVGDTGNAPDGVYHLHFEVKDEDNDATDPYERLDGTPFTLKQKMSFLEDILKDVDDPKEYAEFLVANFPEEFTDAAIAEYSLPSEVDEVLEDTGVDENIELLAQLNELIEMIPSVIPVGVSEGDAGVAVSLLQTYLIFNSEGNSRDALANASATGYFGPITTAALAEYQDNNRLDETGVFDLQTKEEMS
jgi:peptidoglycan hydrolase-like protein with peptidoglycan-binding domain